ncbi:MAG: uroporphyrinogen decarboxylase family protein [Candidatus Ratteibacteria bacterium]
MDIRERILSVFAGEKPDCVPFILDMSHWYYHRYNLPWDLTMPYDSPDEGLIDIHKKFNVGFYIPILSIGWKVQYTNDVEYRVWKEKYDNSISIIWEYHTPYGVIRRRRAWEQKSYSWPIKEWGIKSRSDIKILQYALVHRKFYPDFDSYMKWKTAVGRFGIVYMPFGYSAMGQLLNAWMGVAETIYATYDMKQDIEEFVSQVNENNLKLVDLLCESPAEVIMMGDNFSSDIQSPEFFSKWSKSFYTEAIRRFHLAGKKVAVHIDGRLRNCIKMIVETGADCGDAITPAPMGDLTPIQCRQEAGRDFILSGGVPPDVWLQGTSLKKFKKNSH